jgi:hypothetical protein
LPPRGGNRHDTDNFAEDYGNDVDRLQDAERRAAMAEAARRDQEVRLAQLERQIANESNNNSGGSSPKQPSPRRRRCIVVVVVAVLIAAAVAGICGTGLCSSPTTTPMPSTMPTAHLNTTPTAHPNTAISPKPIVPTSLPQPVLQPVLQPVPQPVPPPTPPPIPPPLTDEPTMAPTIMPSLAVPVSSDTMVPTAAPTWTVVTVTLEDMELVYSNVDVIDPLQLEMIENVTEMWFNEYYNDKDNTNNNTKNNTTSSKRNEDEEETESNTTVTALFDFVSQDYNVTKKTMTVLFAVQLTYKGNPYDVEAILQMPWQDASSVGTYRQLLVAELPESFASVEATAPPQWRKIVIPSPPPKSNGKDKK